MPREKFPLFVLLAFPALLTLAAPALADSAVCEAYTKGVSSPEMKARLLADVKKSLVRSASASEKRLDDAIECFRSKRSEPICLLFREKLLSVLDQRLHSVKMLTAIADSQSGRLARSSRKANFATIRNQEIPAEMVANFSATGYQFSAEEKATTLRIWRHMTLQSLSQEIEKKNLRPDSATCLDFNFTPAPHLRQAVQQIAKNAVTAAMEQNPLLEILHTKPLNEKSLENALVQMRDYNDKFVKIVEDMRIDHTDSIPSRFILTAHDHEMALVNFPKFALAAIEAMPESERANACASWERLEKQQSQRVKSSIGVGFSTALVCGVGIISGLGTGPALVACTPSIADSLWGGYRGYADSKTARLSAFSGRGMNDLGEMTPGIRSKEEAQALARQGNLVAFINFAGIAPVLSGAKAAHVGVKGSFKGFAKIPISDSSVSALEMSAERLANILHSAKEEKITPLNQAPSYRKVAAFKDQCDLILNNQSQVEEAPETSLDHGSAQ
jgi:hypothetical protein